MPGAIPCVRLTLTLGKGYPPWSIAMLRVTKLKYNPLSTCIDSKGDKLTEVVLLKGGISKKASAECSPFLEDIQEMEKAASKGGDHRRRNGG